MLSNQLFYATVLAFVLLTFGMTSAGLEAQTATLAVVPQGTPAMPGSVATASVTVEGSAAVSGFSYGLLHDPAVLSFSAPSVTIGAGLAASHGGLGPDFISIDLFQNGFTFATVINTDVAGPDLLANTVHVVTAMSYSVAPTAQFGSTALVFTDTLGVPPVALSVGMGVQFVEPPTLVNASLSTTIPFRRGDLNQNGDVTISDVIFLLTQLFGGVPLTCHDSADTDGNGLLTLTDAIFLLVHLFDGGPAPIAPFEACGVPAAPSPLGCNSFICP